MNFVCCCKKLFLAVSRRIFHRSVIVLSAFTDTMGRTGAACTSHEDHPTCAFAGQSLQEIWHHTSSPQHIWWLDLHYIHFEAFPKETQCPQSCFEGACGGHCCYLSLPDLSQEISYKWWCLYLVCCVILHPLKRRQWNVFPGASWLMCRLQGKSCSASPFILKEFSKVWRTVTSSI